MLGLTLRLIDSKTSNYSKVIFRYKIYIFMEWLPIQLRMRIHIDVNPTSYIQVTPSDSFT